MDDLKMVTNITLPVVFESSRLAMSIDEDGTPVDAAYWVFEEDSRRWRFCLASSFVVSRGPCPVYKDVNSHLVNEGITLIEPDDISVVDPDNEILDQIRKTHPFTKPGISMYIESASGRSPFDWNSGLGFHRILALWAYDSQEQRKAQIS